LRIFDETNTYIYEIKLYFIFNGTTERFLNQRFKLKLLINFFVFRPKQWDCVNYFFIKGKKASLQVVSYLTLVDKTSVVYLFNNYMQLVDNTNTYIYEIKLYFIFNGTTERFLNQDFKLKL
jgi:hypothetical protein